MRNKVIGLVLGGRALGRAVLCGLPPCQACCPSSWAPVMRQAIKAAAAHPAGFVGLKRVGAWAVACAAKPSDRSMAADYRGQAGAGAAVARPAAKEPSRAPPRRADKPRGRDKHFAGPLPRHRSNSAARTTPKAVALTMTSVSSARSAGQARPVRSSAHRQEGTKSRATPGQARVQGAGRRLRQEWLHGRWACWRQAASAPFAGPARGELVLPPGPEGKRRRSRCPWSGWPHALAAIRRAES